MAAPGHPSSTQSTAVPSSSNAQSIAAEPELAPSARQVGTGAAEEQAANDDDDEEDEDDEEEGGEEVASTGANSKQRKKKKSKAAAKLRKKLGLGGGTTATPEFSDQMVSQIQKSVEAEHGAQAAVKVDRNNLAKVMAALNMERDAMHKSQESKQKGQKAIANHKFWKTQPVAKPEDTLPRSNVEEGPIQPNQPPSQVRQEPYPLPKDFEWVTIDIDADAELKEVYELLSANYVEDDDASLRFKYSPEFLKWVLKHPGYRKTWHVGVRVSSSRKLVAFISGIPHELRVREQSFHSTEINFLCVHKKLRSKRLTPVLIQEVTRQCNLTGVFQAIYTAGIVIPTPMSCARYYHRTINTPKLLDIGFAAIPHGMSKTLYEQRYELPDAVRLGAREMQEPDVPKVGKLLRRYMRRFDMAPRFNDDEVRHVMLSGRGQDVNGKRVGQVTWTYVIEDKQTGSITDVFSFYSLPSSVLSSSEHSTLNAAYLFYYATDVPFQHSTALASSGAAVLTKTAESTAKPGDVPDWQRSSITGLSPEQVLDEENVTKWDLESPSTKTALKKRLNELVLDLLIIAKKNDFDVVNCLTVMDNQLFLSEQKFGPGDGFLRFYLFNWRVQPICGGMGNRAGEADFDPVVAQIKSSMKNAKRDASGSGGKASADEELRLLLEGRPRAEMGSGLGVVMV